MANDAYIISTERLGLRRWAASDIAPFINMNKDPDVMRYFPSTLTGQETIDSVNRINSFFDANNFGLFAVEKKATNEFIGFTGFAEPSFQSFFTPCIEIGWRFKKEEWGKGYATEAAMACLNYGFEQLNFDTVYSWTAAINLPSEKVMQRIGMMKIGEFDHPKIPTDHTLCKHVLYQISKAAFNV